MVAQRLTSIVPAEQTALLQHRHNLIDKDIQLQRELPGQQDEAVASALAHPLPMKSAMVSGPPTQWTWL